MYRLQRFRKLQGTAHAKAQGTKTCIHVESMADMLVYGVGRTMA